jgi:hypothetical protein
MVLDAIIKIKNEQDQTDVSPFVRKAFVALAPEH